MAEDLFSGFAQGFATGSQIDAMRQRSALLQAQRQQAEQEALMQKQMYDDLTTAHAITDPRLKIKTLTDLAIKYPTISTKLNESSKLISSEQKENVKRNLLPAYNALTVGKTDIALQKLTEQERAFRNAGDSQQADQLKNYIESVKNAPDQALTTGTMYMMNMLGVDEFKSMYDPEATRKIIALPFEQRKTIAETLKSEEEQRRAPIETEIKQQELGIKKVDAQYAEQLKKLDVQNKQADLALTNQQKLQAVAAARKINTEIEQMSKQVANGKINIADPVKRFEFEQKLRDEYKNKTKTFSESRDAYDRISAIYGTYVKPDRTGKVTLPKGETMETAKSRQAAGDLGLIFNYMKMLDPGSTVREGEFATAANSRGVDDAIRSLYNKVASGERLTPNQRGAYYNQAKVIYNQAKKRADETKKDLSVVVDNYGLTKENVFVEPKGIVQRIQ